MMPYIQDEVGEFEEMVQSFLRKEKWDEAIEVLTQALALAEKNSATDPKIKAAIYLTRVAAFVGKGNHKSAIDDCNKALELDNNKCFQEQALSLMAYIFQHQCDYYGVIECCNKMRELGCKHFLVHDFLVSAYIGKKDYESAIEKIREAREIHPRLDDESPPFYIESRIKSFMEPEATFERFLGLRRTIYDIQDLLVYRPSKDNKFAELIAHYTKEPAMEALVKGDRFHLNNAGSMKDETEGNVLFGIMSKSGNQDFKTAFYPNDKRQHSPAYIGSFVQMEEDNERVMWCRYGDKGKGFRLHFDADGFLDHPPWGSGKMLSLSMDKDGISSPVEEEGKCIYKIMYEDDVMSKENEGLYSNLQSLRDKLSCIMKKNWRKEEKKIAFELAGELLDDIRFLFKSSNLKEEKELRIIVSRYEKKQSVPIDLRLRELVIGPRVQREKDPESWSWIK